MRHRAQICVIAVDWIASISIDLHLPKLHMTRMTQMTQVLEHCTTAVAMRNSVRVCCPAGGNNSATDGSIPSAEWGEICFPASGPRPWENGRLRHCITTNVNQSGLGNIHKQGTPITNPPEELT